MLMWAQHISSNQVYFTHLLFSSPWRQPANGSTLPPVIIHCTAKQQPSIGSTSKFSCWAKTSTQQPLLMSQDQEADLSSQLNTREYFPLKKSSKHQQEARETRKNDSSHGSSEVNRRGRNQDKVTISKYSWNVLKQRFSCFCNPFYLGGHLEATNQLLFLSKSHLLSSLLSSPILH